MILRFFRRIFGLCVHEWMLPHKKYDPNFYIRNLDKNMYVEAWENVKEFICKYCGKVK